MNNNTSTKTVRDLKVGDVVLSVAGKTFPSPVTVTSISAAMVKNSAGGGWLLPGAYGSAPCEVAA